MNLFDPGIAPFTAALLVMVLILLAELASAVAGASATEFLDNALPKPGAGAVGAAGDGAQPGVVSRFLSWLHIGRAPLLLLAAAFLTSFGIAGLVVQSIAKAVSGAYFSTWLVAALALAAAMLFTHVAGRMFSRPAK